MEVHPEKKQSSSHIQQTCGAQTAASMHCIGERTSASIWQQLSRIAELQFKVQHLFHRILLQFRQQILYQTVSRPTESLNSGRTRKISFIGSGRHR